jgi:two-component system phosphate regulon sensor histidine kinase PhoR
VKNINHKLFVTAFAIVLFGIIAIQVYWMNKAIVLKNEQFTAAVINAGDELNKELEQNENLIILNGADSVNILTEDIRPEKNTQIIKTEKINGKEITSSYSYSISSDSGDFNFVSKNDKANLNAFVFSSEDTVISETHLMDDKLEKVKILIQKFATSKENKALKLDGTDVYDRLKKIFIGNNLNMDFELALKENGKLTYVSDSSFIAELNDPHFTIGLFNNDVLKRNVLINLYFPNRISDIYGSSYLIMLLLLIFVALVFYIFYKTLKNYNKQKQLNEIKSEFINNMTHELKTPLATIQLASEVINKQASEEQEQIKKMSKTIKEQSIKMDNDIKNMLQHAVIEQSSFKQLNKSSVNISELVNKSIEHVSLIAADKGIKFNLNKDKDYVLNIDAELLYKVFVNLLDNSIKYSETGNDVNITIGKDKSFCVISVRDNGQGISKEDLPYVFDKFYRSGKGNIHSNKGYGLGLSFVKRIVELHEGRVEAYSNKEKGTSIIISLPLHENG